MKRRLLLIICVATLVAGCTTTQRSSRYVSASVAPDDTYQGAVVMATASPAPALITGSPLSRHTVKPGETLWSISRAYNVDLDTLARVNSITDNSLIEKGQVLIIPSRSAASSRSSYTQPATQSKAFRSTQFAWPVRGAIVSRFGEKLDNGISKGIDIRAADGMNVAASRDGRVVYCDSQLKGFGTTVIIDHLDGFQTVYSYNSVITVNVGDTVRQNQTIAKVGQSGRAQEPMLHFEIRKGGEPVDPTRYLPR